MERTPPFFLSLIKFARYNIQSDKRQFIQNLYPQQISYIRALAHKFLGLFPFYCRHKAHSESPSRIAAGKKEKNKDEKFPDNLKFNQMN